MALAATALEAPAYAQKKDGEAAAKNYSKGFIAAYNPVKELQDAATPDTAALTAAVPSLVAAIETEDDRFVAGNTIFSIGRTTENPELQYQGVTMMLQSGRVPAENLGQYNMVAGQLAYNSKNFADARTYLQAAYDAGETDPDPRMLIAESYFANDQYAEGLAILDGAIEERKAAGLPVEESWLKRGLTIGYQNDRAADAMRYATWYAQDYPSQAVWSDVVAVALNMSDYQAPEVLDLLRLALRLDAIQQPQLYHEYIEAADPRRLPGEVVAVIDRGWNSGVLERDNTFVTTSRAEAAARVDADRADLPAIASEARAADASLTTVLAAGDAFLSYDQSAEAEEFYAKALGMAGADKSMVLTRLGIAQLNQGKTAEAKANFAQVEGQRQPIARLWSVYADQQGV
ncbi:hypothetical protein [Qipengyuania sp. MTN3-11]|uniref:hypothetical protein n=1 Tax=Qipengyuania sp. MTN3-11 TaxID=3056557 RepID=UPI0036F2A8E5